MTSPVLKKALVILIVLIGLASIYTWANVIIIKIAGERSLETSTEILEEIGKKILEVEKYGGKRVITLKIPGEIFVGYNFIEIKTKTKSKQLPSKFVPVKGSYYPLVGKKIPITLNESYNCSQVDCSWCLDKYCDDNDVKVGYFENYTVAVFWIYDSYRAVCFSEDNLSDGYLEINESTCFYEDAFWNNYRILLIDEYGNYVILEGDPEKVVVRSYDKRMTIVGRSIGVKEAINILRLYILDFKDDSGVIHEVVFECGGSCWKEGGWRTIEIWLDRVVYEENREKKFIKIRIL